ncbi:hypothetical protein PIB30_078203 [Stylosanthes scabra]|uniref:Uncharacterized protein n=1 Tax=Stylosanthes scabra TaxID=79078 RepID=A0ABU6WSD4_9FABA|nr:hypothetical protein [Stylosanthes scabra]
MEQANYMGNAPRPPYNDSYSKTFNLGWRNHPNFGWGNQGNQGQNHYNNFQRVQGNQTKKWKASGERFEEPAEDSLQNQQKEDATFPKPTEKEVQKPEEKEMHKQKSATPKILYPQRLKVENKDKQFSKFLEMFR